MSAMCAEHRGAEFAPHQQALLGAARTYLNDLDNDTSRQRLIAALLVSSPLEPSPVIDHALDAIAADNSVNHQRLLKVAENRLIEQRLIGDTLDTVYRGEMPSETQIAAAAEALDDSLILRLLSDYILASSAVEALVTALRATWLAAAVSSESFPWPPPRLLNAVALQMQMTEWVYEESPRESAQLAVLETQIRNCAAEALPWRDVVVYALYRPLSRLGEDERLMALPREGDGRDYELLRRHLIEPGEERTLASNLPRLTEPFGALSRTVQMHYEEQPYPRWRYVSFPRRRSLGTTVARAVGNPDLATQITIDKPDVLIAGCGTGRHAVVAASRYEGAQVLAIDLSIDSLAYGARQARHLGISNIEFAQADVLGLESLDRTFDVVESVGVLHHLADPEAGWAILRKLLRPGGLMKLGLYSAQGRKALDAIAQHISDLGLQSTLDGIRMVRKLVRDLPPDSEVHRFSQAPDFFSRSGCRDLFFHEQEVRFDLPRISRALAALQLEFVGFELPSPRIRGLYLHHFPNEITGRSLENWGMLERMYPSLFRAMYRFWTRAPL